MFEVQAFDWTPMTLVQVLPVTLQGKVSFSTPTFPWTTSVRLKGLGDYKIFPLGLYKILNRWGPL